MNNPAPTMPPKKTPKKPTDLDLSEVLALCAKNLDEMERYYRRQPAGPEIGQFVVMTLCASMAKTALTLAIEGKSWTPPA